MPPLHSIVANSFSTHHTRKKQEKNKKKTRKKQRKNKENTKEVRE
jgi:hypothetical protein